jgi:hypothetical protein
MVLVDITPEEVKALDTEVYGKIECRIAQGTILGLLRVKIQEAFAKDLKKRQIEKAKEILNVKKKN